jgi:acyl-CoA synthetase (NDP forming)
MLAGGSRSTATARMAASFARRRPSQAGTQMAAAPALGAVRNLNVHEYISMEIMKNHGIRTPECYVASTPEEAEHVFKNNLQKRACTHSSI